MSNSSRPHVRAAVIGALLAFTAAACGSESSPEPEVRTEVRTVTVEATTAPPTSVERIVVPEVTTTSPPPPPAPAYMPAVLCMNLQSAQNAIQAAGIFYSRSADASGAGRMQVNDSNWIVVEQDPQAGTLIDEGDALLSVVKIGEPSIC